MEFSDVIPIEDKYEINGSSRLGDDQKLATLDIKKSEETHEELLFGMTPIELEQAKIIE
jgi:hypothetical protein